MIFNGLSSLAGSYNDPGVGAGTSKTTSFGFLSDLNPKNVAGFLIRPDFV